ncbi:hypothetical protein BCR37DRAFT_351178 [Protomyces lactucae-debilis]|uniref:Mitochondrial distribution and morphology protein 12 n=1 Tax=Protomyces lactucae-debilis TaxID=2754530 RepID=A0A1Y2EZE4_PROLT|nr:uncharacterized protein BCR37DRAFT_351178 [Protomyces lactucae-debilis]ORY76969.1 hypothetical protein BCR37DRAFT_351178 [Protomyces lactucae-debilis]
MSLDIDWSLLTDDHALAIERFVNEKLGEIELPDFLHNLRVLHFELGKIGPEVSIVDICDPLPEFYEPGEEEVKSRAEEAPIDTVAPADAAASSLRGINPMLARHLQDSELDISIDEQRAGNFRIPRRRTSDEDVQFHIKLVYKGDMKLVVAVDLALNYPSPFFVTLPLELTLSDLHIESTAAVAYMAPRPDSSGGDLVRKKSPIRGFHIESRIGGSGPQEDAVDAIRDVEKVERLMLKMIRELLEKEIVFPSSYTLILG